MSASMELFSYAYAAVHFRIGDNVLTGSVPSELGGLESIGTV